MHLISKVFFILYFQVLPFFSKISLASEINIIAVGSPEETYGAISHSIEAFEQLNEHETFRFESTEYHFSSSVRCRVKNYEEECDFDDIKHPYVLEFGMITSRIFSRHEIDIYPDLQLYPAFAIGVVVIYNIPELENQSDSDVVLTPALLAKIFQSKITQWNDSRILSLNPHINDSLPHTEIKVCVRDDVSGITEIFKKFLSDSDSDFAMNVGVSANSSWGELSAEYRTGKKGVLSYITTEEYSITYFPYDVEILRGSPMVTIQQPNQQIPVSQQTIQAAVHDLGTHFSGDEDPNVEEANFFTADLQSSDAISSWPIVGYSYFGLRRELSHDDVDCEVVEHTAQFFDWFYKAKSVRRLLEFLGFGTFPHLHVEDIEEHFWNNWYCHGDLVEPGYFRSMTVAGPSNFEGVFDWFESVFYGQFGDEEIIDIHYHGTVGEGEDEGSAYQEFMDGEAHVIVSHRFGNGNNQLSNLLEIPFFTAQTSIIVNLCEDHISSSCNSTVYMDAECIAGIFDGSITMWNDQKLVFYNPFLSQYPYSIRPILDEEHEEATQMFVEHMVSLVPDFELETAFATENNMHHVEAFVYATPYSIGVTFLNPDVEHIPHVTFVHFVESDGTVSYPTMSNSLCVTDAFDESLLSSFTASDLSDCSYPFLSTYYLFSRKSYVDSSQGHCDYVPLVIAQFLDFLLDDDKIGALYQYDLIPLIPMVDGLYEYAQERVDKVTCDDTSLLLGEVEHRHQAEALKEVAIGLAGISILLCVGALAWVIKHRKMRIIRFSQPLFLYIMLVGCMIYSLTLVFITLDEYYFPAKVDEFGFETYSVLDSTCQVIPWLYSTGFTLIFGSLLGKTWRIKEIFINPELKKKVIKNKTVLLQVGSGLFVVWTLGTVWAIHAPLHWVKVDDVIDPVNGVSALAWHGRCGSSKMEVFLPILLLLQFMAFLYGTVLSYKIRSLKDDFSETTSINLAMFTNMQALFFVVLLGYIEQHNPTLLLLVITFFILLGGLGTTALIIIPKIWIIHFAKKVGVDTNQGMKKKDPGDPLASHTTSSNNPTQTQFGLGTTTQSTMKVNQSLSSWNKSSRNQQTRIPTSGPGVNSGRRMSNYSNIREETIPEGNDAENQESKTQEEAACISDGNSPSSNVSPKINENRNTEEALV